MRRPSRDQSPHDSLRDPALLHSLPRLKVSPPFGGSHKCRECHPEQHASWYASYHRQMTQVARPETVLGRFDGSLVQHDGQIHRVVQNGEELWVESMPATAGSREIAQSDQRGEETIQRVLPPTVGDGRGVIARRAVLTTGAHHMQAYWAADGKGNRLQELPVIFIRGPRPNEGRWAPLASSYISQSPAGADAHVHWNTDCILCHATRGVPGLQADGATETSVTELGITCESCHGPAQRHIDLAGSSRGSARDEALQAIVNPARLPPERGAQVCGHCHAAAMFVTPRLMQDFFLSGSAYRPGDDLLQTRIAVLPARLTKAENEENQRYNPAYEGSYWPDGMIRVTGREYNGLVESVCYQKGGMTCLSCHSMHQSDPDDQLSAVGRGNQACFQCHETYRDDVTAHTHHAVDSSGSECYNCHMPHTTYGLFSAIRSHKITSPSVASALDTGRSTACNLCHLDQTLAWVDQKLAEWYGQPRHELEEERRLRSEAGLLLLKGDAAQRVIFAWAAGWQAALDTSGRNWLPPVLAPLLSDPSPVVRLVASRSLAKIDHRYEFEYDYASPAEGGAATAKAVLNVWDRLELAARKALPERVFIRGGSVDHHAIGELLRKRDDRGLLIVE